MARVLLLAVFAAALLGAADGAAVQAQNPKLFGTVGPSFSIILRDAQGNRVSTLPKGTYDIEVQDLAEDHNFHLTGPGVDRETGIGSVETVTWTVTFTDGVYRYVCDPHSGLMRGSFTVGNPPTTTPPPPITPKTKLVLTSGPSRSITLRTGAGKKVTAMKLGTYTMVVRDRSRIHNAHVVAPGYNRRTTVPFVGTRTWKVKLAKTGTLRFLSDPHASLGMRGSAKIVR
ncbi:MAG TPA: plastocyanin/azurin family copper-binding protein [Gaiellaceae bacterium]|nr:plastocyanin/azurin family copper-binding protein [Gaiellaceae bacterium]